MKVLTDRVKAYLARYRKAMPCYTLKRSHRSRKPRRRLFGVWR